MNYKLKQLEEDVRDKELKIEDLIKKNEEETIAHERHLIETDTPSES